MSLANMNWRYVGSGVFGSATVAAVLDALYTLGTAVTYADGTARTEGSGSAWTWTGNRYQNAGTTESCHPAPPTNTLNHRVILAGSASSVAGAVAASPDSTATNILMASLAKNAGAYNAWNNAAPFTSGDFFGFWRLWPTTAGTGTVYLYEAKEAIAVLIATSGGSVYGCIIGAIVDPESTDVTADAESDGKLYGMVVTGTTAVMNTSFWSTANAFMTHSGSASAAHAGIFTPGASSLLTMSVLNPPLTSMTSTGVKKRSGRFGRVALGMRAAAAAPNDHLLGRLREVFLFSDGTSPTKQTNGGTTIGYVFAASTASASDALLLEHG
jgi:hypothetical protein